LRCVTKFGARCIDGLCGRRFSDDSQVLIFAEDGAEGVAHLAYGRVGADGFDGCGDDVAVLVGGVIA